LTYTISCGILRYNLREGLIMFFVKEKKSGKILAGLLEVIECEQEAKRLAKKFIEKGFAKEVVIDEIFDLNGNNA